MKAKIIKSTSLSTIILALTFLLTPAYRIAAEIDPKQFSDAFTKFTSTEAGQEALANAVEGAFKKRQERAVKDAEAKQKAELEEQFKNPIKFEIGGSPVKGPANAKVTIFEFSDFQCPFCKRGADNLEQVVKAYPNDVKLVFKNLPLAMHPEAMPAAKAALAAHKQGKFWEMYSELFNNQGSLNSELYSELAKKLNLNLEKFKSDMASPEIEKQVKDDMAQAQSQQIQGTPFFSVGGVAVRGAYPPEHFKTIIDRHLDKK
jgi:protein-disulfide isomerase